MIKFYSCLTFNSFLTRSLPLLLLLSFFLSFLRAWNLTTHLGLDLITYFKAKIIIKKTCSRMQIKNISYLNKLNLKLHYLPVPVLVTIFSICDTSARLKG